MIDRCSVGTLVRTTVASLVVCSSQEMLAEHRPVLFFFSFFPPLSHRSFFGEGGGLKSTWSLLPLSFLRAIRTLVEIDDFS